MCLKSITAKIKICLIKLTRNIMKQINLLSCLMLWWILINKMINFICKNKKIFPTPIISKIKSIIASLTLILLLKESKLTQFKDLLWNIIKDLKNLFHKIIILIWLPLFILLLNWTRNEKLFLFSQKKEKNLILFFFLLLLIR